MAVVSVRLEHAFDLHLSFGAELAFGPTPFCESRVYAPVLTGRVAGSRFNGIVVAGSGGEWPHLLLDGIASLEGQWLIRADDGTLILMKMAGYWRGAPVTERVGWRGDSTEQAQALLHTSPYFEAPIGAHEWITRMVFVGIGDRRRNDSMLHVFSVL
jgi:hypothetical protein